MIGCICSISNLKSICAWLFVLISSIIKITKDQNSYSFDDGCLNVLKVRKKLEASLDYLIIFEKMFDSKQPLKTTAIEEVIPPGMPDGVAFAIARQNGKMIRQRSADRQRALRRKTGR